MDLKEMKDSSIDPHKHWYYRSKSKCLMRLINGINPTNILDIGSGSCFFSEVVLQKSGAQKSICVDTGYETEGHRNFNGKEIIYCQKLDESVNVDLVLMMDILEHIDDDSNFLKNYVSKVPDKTYFLMTVPAFSFLWSPHDEFLLHRRRYNYFQFKKLVQNSELEIHQISFFFLLVFPLAAVLRIFNRIFGIEKNKSQVKHHSSLVNFILSLVCLIEIPILKINKFCGLTIFCLARKIK